jgi:hypothetical protein
VGLVQSFAPRMKMISKVRLMEHAELVGLSTWLSGLISAQGVHWDQLEHHTAR